jgi:uncharacterized Fe-S cluster-containing radical SAM superfamily protein
MELSFPFDPIERSGESERQVMRGEKRLYYKFRAAPYYGGIATADAVGCSFLCAYCWNYSRNLNPSRFGRFYSPEEVASILQSIAKKRFFHLYRITGSEPILGEISFNHLIRVIQNLFQEKSHSIFVLETNGLILGYKKELIGELKFKNLWVRIAIKGTDSNSFEKITGAKKEFFHYPLLALKELEDRGIKAWPAAMRQLFTNDEITNLKKVLAEHKIKAELELETLEPYPFVLENLKRRNVRLKR